MTRGSLDAPPPLGTPMKERPAQSQKGVITETTQFKETPQKINTNTHTMHTRSALLKKL